MRLRRKRFDLPPQPDLEIPLLWYIARSGGEIKVSWHREKLKAELAAVFDVPAHKLTETTRDGRESRWWNHIRHVRRMLVDKGELDGSVRDMWCVTDLGRDRLRQYLRGIAPDLGNSVDPIYLQSMHTQVVELILRDFHETHSEDYI